MIANAILELLPENVRVTAGDIRFGAAIPTRSRRLTSVIERVRPGRAGLPRTSIRSSIHSKNPSFFSSESPPPRFSRAIDCLLNVIYHVKARRLSVRDLGRATKLRSAMATVCALICRRILYTELSTKFGPASLIARRADPGVGTSPPVQRQKPTATAGELGGSKR
jgi:hypothetical protein